MRWTCTSGQGPGVLRRAQLTNLDRGQPPGRLHKGQCQRATSVMVVRPDTGRDQGGGEGRPANAGDMGHGGGVYQAPQAWTSGPGHTSRLPRRHGRTSGGRMCSSSIRDRYGRQPCGEAAKILAQKGCHRGPPGPRANNHGVFSEARHRTAWKKLQHRRGGVTIRSPSRPRESQISPRSKSVSEGQDFRPGRHSGPGLRRGVPCPRIFGGRQPELD